jgi:nitroimidazol reductase NimA-like FMN-containing flavoprotein (pyridoxamine 5'-phosphate oxidase superfamily)
MRRKDREITERAELGAILDKAMVCRVALNTGTYPYIVPLSFGYSWDQSLELFFHCAPAGRKLDLLSENNAAGFEIDTGSELVTGDKACDWGMKYQSLVGTGTVVEVTDQHERLLAFERIMAHYGHVGPLEFDAKVLERTKVLKLRVGELSGKARG